MVADSSLTKPIRPDAPVDIGSKPGTYPGGRLITDPDKIPDATHYAIVWLDRVAANTSHADSRLHEPARTAFQYEVFADPGQWKDAVTNAWRDRKRFRALRVTPHTLDMQIAIASATREAAGLSRNDLDANR